MKRKLISLFLALTMLFCLVLAVHATDPSAPLVVDNAGLFTSDELADLTRQCHALRAEYDMDVVILTVYSLDGKSARSYADDFYDGNGYGVGSNYSGVLFLLAMESREWYISTCGDGMLAVSDWDVDSLFSVMSYDLSNGYYYDAFCAYLGELPRYFEAYRSYDSSNTPYYPDYDDSYDDYRTQTGYDMRQFLIALLLGACVAGIALLIMRSSMNTRKPQHNARDYLDSDSYHLRVRQDVFLYSQVHKTPKPQNNGTGGSSGHRSSGGRSHGGGGGRF